jgi:hypothetical protein
MAAAVKRTQASWRQNTSTPEALRHASTFVFTKCAFVVVALAQLVNEAVVLWLFDGGSAEAGAGASSARTCRRARRRASFLLDAGRRCAATGLSALADGPPCGRHYVEVLAAALIQ